MELLQKFKAELEKRGVTANNKILVAVSGGLDSMVLLHLSLQAGLKVLVAHVNYNKRGDESSQDEALVRNFCNKKGVQFFSKQVNLKKTDLKDGFQAEARKVRYTWFNNLIKEHSIDFIFTAHHLNDRIETFFINLLRGAGLKGLKSIPAKKNKIIRPLLPFQKNELEYYAEKNAVPWRLDKSNLSDAYLRNRIRQALAVEFRNISSTSEHNAAKSMDFLAEADSYFQGLAEKRIEELESSEGVIEISDAEWSRIFLEKPLHKYLFEKLGFYPEQLSQLEHFGESQSGKRIIGFKSLVYRDREKYVIKKIEKPDRSVFHIDTPEGEISQPLNLKWQTVKNVNRVELKNPNLAYLNLSKLTFPLRLRPWREGDRFKPYGMKGNKKLSDFFIDLKLSTPQKENTYVLLSGSDIVWVVGHRVSNEYAITNQDKSIIRFEQNI